MRVRLRVCGDDRDRSLEITESLRWVRTCDRIINVVNGIIWTIELLIDETFGINRLKSIVSVGKSKLMQKLNERFT